MKRKVSRPNSVFISVHRPHLEDLESVLEIVEQAGMKFSLSDSQYEYDEISEIIDKHGKYVSELQILAKSDGESSLEDSLSIDFKDGVFHLFNFRWNSRDVEPTWYALKDFLEGHRTRRMAFFSSWYWWLAFIVLSFNSLLVSILSLPAMLAFTYLAIVAFALIMSLIATMLRRRGRTMVLEKRHSVGFWIKNRDSIILLIIGSLLGSLFTVLFEKLFL